MNNTYLFHKPYGVLSQFTREVPSHKVIGDYYEFPPDVYPIGRLDKDSEGLLILSDDKKLVDRLLNPTKKKSKTYLVQVEGEIAQKDIEVLSKGVTIKLPNKKLYSTLPCQVSQYNGDIPGEREPPVRFRASIPTSWILITLIEGKNRQVRKMCAKVGFPVLRLIRLRVGDYQLGDMKIGEVKKLNH